MAIEVYLYEPYNGSKPNKKILYSTADPKIYDFAPGIIKDEVNKAGSFEFDIYPNHPLYKNFKPFYTYVGVEDSNQYGHESVLFYGRVINYTIEMHGGKHVLCEGLLANLLDCPAFMPQDQDPNLMFSIKSQGTKWLFMYPLNAYDELMDRDDIWYGGVDYGVQIMSDDWMEYNESLTQSCGDFIMSLLDTFGGMLYMEYSKYDYKIVGPLYWKTDPISEPNRFPLNNQSFILGENIISATFDNADSNRIGDIFPYGTYKDIEGNDAYAYFSAHNSETGHYLPGCGWSDNADHNYPIKSVKIDGIDGGNGNYLVDTFMRIARKYGDLHCRDYVNDVTVNAVDEYFIGKASRRIHIMDRVHVVVPYADYDETKYCLSYELDIANPANSQFKFGDYKPVSSQKAYYISTHISGKNK